MSGDAVSTLQPARDYEIAAVGWARLTARVVATLRRRGVAREDAEDAAQEAVARALAHAVPYTDDDDLFRWLATVASRIAVDGHRVSCRTQAGEVPDRPSPGDVATTVEARARLAAVAAAFPRLTETEQSALRSGVLGEGAATVVTTADAAAALRRAAVKVAVRRHRARARLTTMTQRFAGSGVVIRLRSRLLVPADGPVAAAAGAPFVALGLLLLAPGAGSPPQPAPHVHTIGAPVAHGGATTPHDGAERGRALRDRSVAIVRGLPAAGAGAGAPVAIPGVRFGVPDAGPVGGHVGTRPRRDDDHDVCVDLLVAGRHCTDLPSPPGRDLPPGFGE